MYKIHTKVELHFLLSEVSFVTFEHTYECYVNSRNAALKLASDLAMQEMNERCKTLLESGVVNYKIQMDELN